MSAGSHNYVFVDSSANTFAPGPKMSEIMALPLSAGSQLGVRAASLGRITKGGGRVTARKRGSVEQSLARRKSPAVLLGRRNAACGE